MRGLRIQRIIIFVFSLLFLISCTPKLWYAASPEVTKWEIEVAALEQLPVSENEQAVLMTGSSSIRLWDSISRDMLPYLAISRAYGGSRLGDFRHYVHRIVNPNKAGAIVIFLANDITGDYRDISPRKVLTYFKSTIKIIRKAHPDTPIFWIEVTPTPARWHVWTEISRASELIEDYCNSTENLYFIKTREYFLNSNNEPDLSLFVEDNLHLNHIGYRIWSTCIKQALDKHTGHLRIMQ
jgi:lysophospholipase L1-like esterase